MPMTRQWLSAGCERVLDVLGGCFGRVACCQALPVQFLLGGGIHLGSSYALLMSRIFASRDVRLHLVSPFQCAPTSTAAPCG